MLPIKVDNKLELSLFELRYNINKYKYNRTPSCC